MSSSRSKTARTGREFSEKTKLDVWQKAQVVPGHSPGDIRKDKCGAFIRFTSYGTHGDYGWEIDHIKPVSKGGTDDLSNLQPLHWQNNRGKGDDYPNWSCTVP